MAKSLTATVPVIALVLAVCAAGRAAPVLEVDKTEWKMGKVARDETRTQTFTLRNTGDEPLVIGQIRPSCKSCLGKLDGDKTLQPGESRPLQITYHAVDSYGQHTASVTIHSNDPEKPLLRLRLSLEVVPRKNKPLLAISPASIDVAVVPVDRAVTVEVLLENKGDAPLDVLSITPSAGCRAIDVSKDAVPPDGRMVVPVEITPRAGGVIRESIGFETSDPDRRSVEIPIEGYALADAARQGAGLVLKPLSLTPAGWRLSLSNLTDLSVEVTFPAAGASGAALVLAPGEYGEKVVPADAAAGLVVNVVLRPQPSSAATGSAGSVSAGP